MEKIITPITATTLTPFAYHSLMVQGGSATLPELIGDCAVAFGLAASLGWTWARVALPTKDYRGHLGAMPFRCSVFIADEPQLLPPLTRRLNIDDEAGIQAKFYVATSKGNVKTYFHIQEVPPYQTFSGAIFGMDPFSLTDEEEIVIRVGLHRNGMIRLRPAGDTLDKVHLNAATAKLFGRDLPVNRYCLHNLQLTPEVTLAQGLEEVCRWR